MEGERNPLRPRNTRSDNKFRLKQKDLVKQNLLDLVVINNEDEDELPLTSLLSVMKKRKLKHGSGREFIELVLKEKKKKEETSSVAKNLKDLILPPVEETPAQRKGGGSLEEPIEGLSHSRIPPAKGLVKNKFVKPTPNKKQRDKTLSSAKNPKDSTLRPMTEPPVQKIDGDNVMRPVEVPGHDLDPPTKNPIIRKLTKSVIKELHAKIRIEMQEERCSKKPTEVGGSPDNSLVLATTTQTIERVVHTHVRRRI